MSAWLEAAQRRPDATAVLLDFDGTLAPIVDDPEAAVPHPAVPALVAELAQRWGTLAVISGRPVSYLIDRLGEPAGAELVGLYGLERAEAGQVVSEPSAEPYRGAVAEWAQRAQAEAPAGVGVEPKGVTLTLHFRRAPAAQEWVEGFAEEMAAATGMNHHEGKMSVEVRPPLEVDKGTVVRSVAADMTAVLYAGDDVGDLPAFAELAAMRTAGVATLSVVAESDETPAEVRDAADLAVPGPAGVVELLTRLTG